MKPIDLLFSSKKANSVFDNNRSIKHRIMLIISYAAAIGNTIGFFANYLLYGMSVPTAFCGVCAVFVFIYLLFGLHSKLYLFTGYILLFILVVLEFPLLVFAYGSVMYPYMVLGFMTVLMLLDKSKRWPIGVILGLFYLCVIILSGTTLKNVFEKPDEAGLLGSAVVTFTVAIVALAYCVITWQSVYLRDTVETDVITGKLSRIGFLRKAKKIIKNASPDYYSLLSFDVRSFKAINTVYGTEYGNSVLCSVANHIGNAEFSPIILGRLSSDKFACIVKTSNIEKSEIEKLCNYNFSDDKHSISILLSCGIYKISNPLEDVQLICDKASSIIKFIRVGENKCVGFYDEKMHESFIEETEILSDIEKAIFNESFEPYFQPIVDAKTGKIVSAEALARWIHPDKGIISPSVFIPILEKKEMISKLDCIIISKVDELLINRRKNGLATVPVSANLSRVDLFDDNFIKKIKQIINRNQDSKGLSMFEVTESSLMNLPDDVFNLLNSFRKKGAAIFVDDFGSGYSSLSMISSFDFDVIKLDKQFADNIEKSQKNRDIINLIITLAHKFDAKVVAEGVENQQQLDYLRESDCDYIQGFCFYKPMSETEFVKLLDNQFENQNV